MRKMKNAHVVENFVERYGDDVQNHSQSLHTHKGKLISYNTVIAQWTESGLVINATKYSVTTSAIQSMVRRSGVNYTETTADVPMNTFDLVPFIAKKVQYQLVNYFDVWGNKKDGWEVNNLCNEGIIEVNENYTHKELVTALKEEGFFNENVRINMVDIWDDHEMIEFHQRKDQRPVCRLELVQGVQA